MARKSRKNIVAPEVEINIATYIKVAEYIRLSVEDKHFKGNSIENQKLILDDYISKNADMKLVDTYTDNGSSGMNYNRPEFQRMLEDIENKKIDCVIVKDLSRLGRNSIDTGFYIERYFIQKKIRFIAVNDNFDTAHPDRNSGIMLHIKNIINEAYALDIGKKIKSQARQAMRDGQYVSARPRYGYLKDPQDCHKLIVNTEVAPVVKTIFEQFVGGMSYNEICLQLNDKHIPTPSVYGFQKGYITSEKMVGNGLWNTRTLQQLLSQEIYTGCLVQGKSDTVGHHQTMIKDKSKWIVVENTHEAIISKELFKQAQDRMQQLKNNHSALERTPYTENIWKGKIFCGECGRALHRQRATRKKTSDMYFIYCITNTRYKRGGCNNTCIPEKELLSAVIDTIKAHTPVLVERKNQCIFSLSDQRGLTEKAAEIREHKDYIRQNQYYLNSLYESLVNGDITSDEYKNMRDSYSLKIADATEKIKAMELEQAELEKTSKKYYDLSETANQALKNGKLTKEIVDKLIDKIYVYKGRQVEIVFNFNDELQSEVAVNV